MNGRAVPFHCPFCGDVDLRPHETQQPDRSAAGAWECRACLRAFTLRMLGMIAPRPAGPAGPAGSTGTGVPR